MRPPMRTVFLQLNFMNFKRIANFCSFGVLMAPRMKLYFSLQLRLRRSPRPSSLAFVLSPSPPAVRQPVVHRLCSEFASPIVLARARLSSFDSSNTVRLSSEASPLLSQSLHAAACSTGHGQTLQPGSLARLSSGDSAITSMVRSPALRRVRRGCGMLQHGSGSCNARAGRPLALHRGQCHHLGGPCPCSPPHAAALAARWACVAAVAATGALAGSCHQGLPQSMVRRPDWPGGPLSPMDALRVGEHLAGVASASTSLHAAAPRPRPRVSLRA